jgi:hypothetical protein
VHGTHALTRVQAGPAVQNLTLGYRKSGACGGTRGAGRVDSSLSTRSLVWPKTLERYRDMLHLSDAAVVALAASNEALLEFRPAWSSFVAGHWGV